MRHFELVDEALPADFLVIAVASDLHTATFGDVLALKAASRGVTGVVLDGFTRDLAYIVELALPMWCRGTAMIPAGYSSLSVESTGETVTCCGVEVNPGDLVVADGDGVVVVERSASERVAECCEEMEAAEEVARRGAREGRPLSELYPTRAHYGTS
jgi:3-hexulose-6-phosphate synthase/6-phospho-3-hexuloisomerase